MAPRKLEVMGVDISAIEQTLQETLSKIAQEEQTRSAASSPRRTQAATNFQEQATAHQKLEKDKKKAFAKAFIEMAEAVAKKVTSTESDQYKQATNIVNALKNLEIFKQRIERQADIVILGDSLLVIDYVQALIEKKQQSEEDSIAADEIPEKREKALEYLEAQFFNNELQQRIRKLEIELLTREADTSVTYQFEDATELQRQLREKEAELKRLKTELEALQKAVPTHLQSDLATANQRVKTVEDALKEQQEALTNAQARMRAAETRATNAQNELAALRTSSGATTDALRAAETRATNAQNELAAANTARDAANTRATTAEQQLAAAQAKAATAETKEEIIARLQSITDSFTSWHSTLSVANTETLGEVLERINKGIPDDQQMNAKQLIENAKYLALKAKNLGLLLQNSEVKQLLEQDINDYKELLTQHFKMQAWVAKVFPALIVFDVNLVIAMNKLKEELGAAVTERDAANTRATTAESDLKAAETRATALQKALQRFGITISEEGAFNGVPDGFNVDEFTRIKQENASLQTRLAELEATQQNWQTTLASFVADSQPITAEGLKQFIETLNQQLAAAEVRAKQEQIILQTRIAKLEGEVAAGTTTQQASNEELAQLRGQLDAAQADLAAAQQENTKLQNQARQQVETMNLMRSDNQGLVDALNQINQTLASKLEDLISALQATQSKIATLTRETTTQNVGQNQSALLEKLNEVKAMQQQLVQLLQQNSQSDRDPRVSGTRGLGNQDAGGQYPVGGYAPYVQQPYGQPPYGQPPYGQPPYGQPPYGQPPTQSSQPYYGQQYPATVYAEYPNAQQGGQPTTYVYPQQPYGQPAQTPAGYDQQIRGSSDNASVGVNSETQTTAVPAQPATFKFTAEDVKNAMENARANVFTHQSEIRASGLINTQERYKQGQLHAVAQSVNLMFGKISVNKEIETEAANNAYTSGVRPHFAVGRSDVSEDELLTAGYDKSGRSIEGKATIAQMTSFIHFVAYLASDKSEIGKIFKGTNSQLPSIQGVQDLNHQLTFTSQNEEMRKQVFNNCVNYCQEHTEISGLADQFFLGEKGKIPTTIVHDPRGKPLGSQTTAVAGI